LKKLITTTLLLLTISCTKQQTVVTIVSPIVKDTTVVESKVLNHNVQLHVAVLNYKGVSKFGDRAVHLQEDFENADSALIVNQLIYDNSAAQQGATPYDLMHDNQPYDSCFYSDAHGKFIVEVIVDITGLSDTTGKAMMVQRWCDNGYAHHTKSEWFTPSDFLKTIYPNKQP